MSATTESILSFEVVKDHDCGNYSIGEIDVHTRDLEDYISKHGVEALNQAVTTAGWRVMEALRSYNQRNQSPAESKI